MALGPIPQRSKPLKVFIELPGEWEITEVELSKDGRRIELTPRFVRGARSAAVAYLTAVGASGREERALLSVSATQGRFSTVRADAVADTPFDIGDVPPAEELEEVDA